MARSKKNKEQSEAPIPFDEALRRVWSSPPKPKKSKKKKSKKKPA